VGGSRQLRGCKDIPLRHDRIHLTENEIRKLQIGWLLLPITFQTKSSSRPERWSALSLRESGSAQRHRGFLVELDVAFEFGAKARQATPPSSPSILGRKLRFAGRLRHYLCY
jgi:hypothetical protein